MDTLETNHPFCRTDMPQFRMSTIFDVVKHVHSDEKYLVHGYIRQHIINAPELIMITCLWFYFQLKHETYSIVESFDHMNLKENLLRGIYAYGFDKPSAIQQRAIIPIIQGHDVILQAQSGTGKTCTYSIAGLQILDINEPQCQLLRLTATRELAKNSHNILKHLGEYLKVTTRNVIGGTAIRDDVLLLPKGVQSIAGTPGRVCDMISRGCLKLDKLKLFVLDEADECLLRGFKEQICDIMEHLPSKTQICLVSATMPSQVLQFAEKYMKTPLKILVKVSQLTLDGIHQYYVAVEKEQDKLMTLLELFESFTITQAVIYCNTRRKTMWLSEQLLSQDCTVSAVHGDMSQQERETVMKQFRSGATRIFVSTDLMSAGIDSHTMKYQVSLVINYDLPMTRENYIHRIGRSGKYGRKGVSINFVTDDDAQIHQDLQSFYNTQIDELPMDLDSIM